MKKFLAYSFLIISTLGLSAVAATVHAQAADPIFNEQNYTVRQAGELEKTTFSKGAGYYWPDGVKLTNEVRPNFTSAGYYKTDGKLILYYSTGSDGRANDTVDQSQGGDDRLLEVLYLDADNNLHKITDRDTSSGNDATFTYTVAQKFNITNGATNAIAYNTALHQAANKVSFGGDASLRDDTTQAVTIDAQINNLNSQISALQNKLLSSNMSAEERAATQKQLDEMINKREALVANRAAIQKRVAATPQAQVPGNVTFAGFSNCGRIFVNLTPIGGANGSVEYDIAGCFAAFANLGIQVASAPFTYAAGLLDKVTTYTLENFSEHFKKADKDGKEGLLYKPVNDVWKFIKNICNLFFIAALIWIAVKTILDAEGFQEAKRLRNVIIFAILINFSMFFTKLLIDVSNTASVQVYNVLLKSANNQTGQGSVITEGERVTSQNKDFAVNVQDKSLASIFLANLQVQKFIEAGPAEKGIGFGNLSPGFILTYGLLSVIFILVATVVIGTIAGMLIVRFAVLVLLLMTSPIAYISTFTPSAIGSYGTLWWQKLKSNLIFLPVLMVMFYITMVFAKFASDSIGKNGGEYINLIFSYALTISMLVISISVAQAAGGNAAVASFGGKWARGIIGGGTAGLAARFGRRTVGGLSNTVANSDTIKRMSLMRGPLGTIGRDVKSRAEKGAKATFDIRNSKAAGLGDTLGEGIKGGLVDLAKENKELEEARIKARLEATKETAKEKMARELETARTNNKNSLTNADKDLADTDKKILTTQSEIKNLTSALEKDATGSDLASILAMQSKELSAMQAEINTTDKALEAALKAGNGEQVIKMRKTKFEQEKKYRDHSTKGADELRTDYERKLGSKTNAIKDLETAKTRAIQRSEKLKADGAAIQDQVTRFEKSSGKKIESTMLAASTRQADASREYLDFVSKGVMLPNIQKLFGIAGVKDVEKVRKEAFMKHTDEMFKSKDKKETEKMLKTISEMMEKSAGTAPTPAPAPKP